MTTHRQTLKNPPNAKTTGLTDQRFQYTPSCKTNILDTFRKMGWVPPSEARGQSTGWPQ